MPHALNREDPDKCTVTITYTTPYGCGTCPSGVSGKVLAPCSITSICSLPDAAT